MGSPQKRMALWGGEAAGLNKFKIPFEPPWDDLKMAMTAENGIKCYIFDSCVERDPEKRAAIDRDVGELLARAERKKFLDQLDGATARERRKEERAVHRSPEEWETQRREARQAAQDIQEERGRRGQGA